jgi:hypothetical protein
MLFVRFNHHNPQELKKLKRKKGVARETSPQNVEIGIVQ